MTVDKSRTTLDNVVKHFFRDVAKTSSRRLMSYKIAAILRSET